MKINVFHIVSNKNWGGPEEYAYEMVSRLRHDPRFYAEVVCKKNEPVLFHFRRLEIPISILPLKGMTDIDSPTRLARLLRKGHNIVHVHTFKDAFAAVMARRISENRNTRVVLTVHGVCRPKTNYIYRKLYRSIDKIVFVSQRAYDEWMGHAKKFAPTHACIIRDSVIDNPLATPAPDLRQKLGIAPGMALIMFHGRLTPQKGIDILLNAAIQLDKSKYHLVIIGEGERKYMTQLKSFIVEHQLVQNVSLVGFQEDMAHLIQQCDLGVLPSVEPEALGIANLEYMMQGKPHIATNNGAQTEYVTDQSNALLVPPGDVDALASAIRQLLDNPAMRQQMGKQARQDFDQTLNYDIFYDKMTSLYNELLTPKKTSK